MTELRTDDLRECAIRAEEIVFPPVSDALIQAADEIDRLRRLDTEAATYVESVVAMRTDFDGAPPYSGWKGIGLALTEALDERDRLRELVDILRSIPGVSIPPDPPGEHDGTTLIPTPFPVSAITEEE